MATAREYFDQSPLAAFRTQITVDTGSDRYDVIINCLYDFEGGSKYIKIYIPECSIPDQILEYVVQDFDVNVWSREKDLVMKIGLIGTGELVDNRDLRFSGRVLVWTPSIIEKARWENLEKLMAQRGMSLLVRDALYVKARDATTKAVAFISHDSRDKDTFVRDLANRLTMMLCPVWYDEYNLKPGDSLRDSIESGLKATPKCVVVLSKNFFENVGWAKREFDSIYTREIIEKSRLMIPIWLDVTINDVYNYSPILADKVGIDATLGIDEVARQLALALR